MISRSNLADLNGKLESRGARLVAVSKTQPPAAILPLYEAGLRLFGENRVQELLEKQSALPQDVEWHLIGHLQRNKVRSIAPFVAMIHSVDSERLLEEVHRQADKIGRTIPVLLQVHIAQEESKFGWSAAELELWLASGQWKQYPNAQIHGLMGMATFTDNRDQVRMEFRSLRQLFERLNADVFAQADAFCECSMGMSGDWEIAVEEGATLVRIGSLLFGERA
ncbi:MAG: YggS family pyridoxal phosphate-dependent enzyme [Bacteroidetes bacterium]|nr:YggS family pyridoxal phosphate-dependent enzyme [Bacteroidota bacterium]